MSGPTLLTALAAASAVSILMFVVLSRIADMFGGARQRRVLRLTDADSQAVSRPSKDLAGQVGAMLDAVGRRVGRHQRLVSAQDLRDAGFESGWLTPRTVVAIKLLLGGGVGAALALLIPWVPAMMVGAPMAGLLAFVAPSLADRCAQGCQTQADSGRSAGRDRRTARTDRHRDGR